MGLATAKMLAGSGARVAIVDRDAAAASKAALSIGSEHRGYGCDVSKRQHVEQTINEIADHFGRVDAAILFAGISRPTKLLEINQDEYDAVIGINLSGTMYVCQAVAPTMIKQKSGAIVCVGSIAGQRGGGLFGSSHYSASKGGVHSLAKALARELGPHNIRVNAIAPGFVETDIFEGKLTADIRAHIMSTIPLGRPGTTTDIANLGMFLVSDRSAFITGAVIDINGGSHMH
jgi:NAD(P)-dependent dehydrogenase (short-subunit alcohol dehydrogenase family)